MARSDDRVGTPVATFGRVRSLGAPPVGVGSWTSAAELVTVTASASLHTYGSWTQLVASTAAQYDLLLVAVHGVSTNATATESIVSIGFGAAASEVEKFAFACGHWSADTFVASTVAPILVPAATRIAARLQSVVSAKTATVSLSGMTIPGFNTNTIIDTLGVDVATSRGLNMPTSDTYVEVTSSTTRPYRGLVLVPSGATNNQAAATVTYTAAVGASGSEVPLATIRVRSTTAETAGLNVSSPPVFTPCHIPQGSRIACKQSTGATTRDVTVLAIPY